MTATCLSAAFLNHKKKKKKNRSGPCKWNVLSSRRLLWSRASAPCVLEDTNLGLSFSYKPAVFMCVHKHRGRKGDIREKERERGNRFSRPGRAVGKEGSCRGKAEMSQDIPLWLHRAGQIETFLQAFFFSPLCVLSPKVNFTKVNNTFVFYLFPVVSRLFFFKLW